MMGDFSLNLRMEMYERLKMIATADCKDDGKNFVVATRLDVIHQLLHGTPWKRIVEGNLTHIYSRREIMTGDTITIVSSHVDCVYSSLFCESLCGEDGEQFLRGTFDNALTNAAVVELMLSGRLPENVVVAFNGDEEKDSRGAKELLEYLSERNCYVALVVVTDVTNLGWEQGLSLTIENDQNIDLLTAHRIVNIIREKDKGHCGFMHVALPDESWIYGEYKLPCLTLCCPVGGDMHSDEGALARLGSLLAYCDALECLCRVVAE